MSFLTLGQAETSCDGAMAEGRKRGCNSLSVLPVTIYEGRGAPGNFKQTETLDEGAGLK